MNSKIVILDDSVILYQHFISDDNWETVMAFPRGGLTYLIKNDNIKFFAYIDYFYRNCLMTMDLPLYIVDEELGIDGEYDDIEEITEILNRIFPANTDKDLTLYLKKSEAEETYQPIGDYFDGVEYDSSGKTIDFYSQGKLVDSIDATDFIKDGMVDTVSLIELSGDTYLHIVFNTDSGKEPIDINLGDLFNADDYYTKDETDDLLDDKLDASAYTPVDLSNYYNKQDTDDLLDDKLDASAYTPVDLSDYYTKKEVDDLIPEVPSLDGYATKTWVQNQGYINHIKTINNISLIGEGNIQIGEGGAIDAYTREEADERFQPKGDYVTTTTFNTYILNLTQQIESLQDAIERCCGGETGDTLYRWITLTGPNDYICSGTTKYSKEQKQQSTDNGATWTNVSPAEYRTGSAIESQSSDCGYQPTTEYRWVTVSGDYVCSGTTKYNKEKQQYRVDGGAWIDTNPLQTRRGSTVIETQSTDCGYIAPKYRWYQASASDYICSGTTKYYKEYYQVSYNGGKTWTNVTPTQTRTGSVIETQSTDCGYEPPSTYKVSLRYIDGTEDNRNCDGKKELKALNPSNWENISGATVGNCITSIGNLCFYGYSGLTTVSLPNTITSIGGMAFSHCIALPSVSIPSGVTYIGDNGFAQCFSLKSVVVPNGVENLKYATFYQCSAMTSITLSNSLKIIDNDAIKSCSSLQSLTLPSTLTSIGKHAFAYGDALRTVTCLATTPPAFHDSGETGTGGNSGDIFYACPNLTAIKVPSGSVNAYKTAWPLYASIIQAL